jgi:MinD-like ATPase involved in chromosome partitioning or flagellar assembly
MFVVTFYSFRGGVGRTMAVVNIGAALAKQGRRVLLADFDLESPGISHYALTDGRPDKKGVIDYLYEMSEGHAPSTLEDYYFKAFDDSSGGSLFVMPAGRAATHVERIEKLNLSAMYSQGGDGYLIVENLKGLWRDEIEPDYVLIDSRTGYNEVAGICTRQLPDAVVATFIPSPQNLEGLRTVVDQIRTQNKETWRAPVDLHFLASSIPSMDDEDGEIKDAIDRSKQILGFKDLLGCIYYVPSASHLKQTVFTLSKENSRLAKNFLEVAKAISLKNPDDPDGANNFLDRLLNRETDFTRSMATTALEERLKDIRKRHANNPLVLFRLARLRLRQGQTADAIEILDLVLENDRNATEPRLLRGTLHAQAMNIRAATEDLQILLARTDLDALQISRALQTLATIAPELLSQFAELAAIKSMNLDDRVTLLLEVLSRHPVLQGVVGKELAVLLSNAQVSEPKRVLVRNAVILNAINGRRYAEAIEHIGSRPTDSSDSPDLFNYAIAEWGLRRAPPLDLLEALVKQLQNRDGLPPNHLQCLGLALALTGFPDEARSKLETAKQGILRAGVPAFSAWTYETVPARTFANHIDQLLAAIEDGGSVLPPVVSERPNHAH